MAARLALSARVVELKKSGSAKPELNLELSLKGKKLMDQLRDIVADLEFEERALLQKRIQDSDRVSTQMSWLIITGAAIAVGVVGVAGFILINYFERNMIAMRNSLKEIKGGELAHRIQITNNDEFGLLGKDFNDMATRLEQSTAENVNQSWFNSNLVQFTLMLQEKSTIAACAEKLLSELGTTVGALHGMFYCVSSDQGEKELRLVATYAYQNRKMLSNRFAFGEGLVGQCALEQKRILVRNVPNDYRSRAFRVRASRTYYFNRITCDL